MPYRYTLKATSVAYSLVTNEVFENLIYVQYRSYKHYVLEFDFSNVYDLRSYGFYLHQNYITQYHGAFKYA